VKAKRRTNTIVPDCLQTEFPLQYLHIHVRNNHRRVSYHFCSYHFGNQTLHNRCSLHKCTQWIWCKILLPICWSHTIGVLKAHPSILFIWNDNKDTEKINLGCFRVFSSFGWVWKLGFKICGVIFVLYFYCCLYQFSELQLKKLLQLNLDIMIMIDQLH